MNEFSRAMSERTDEQLIDIVTRKRDEYQPEALLAADEEFKRRSLTHEVLVEAEQNLAVRSAVTEEKANAPLDVPWKILAFLFPGFVFLLVSLLMRSDGFERRSWELGRWTLYGVAFYVVAILILTNV